MRQSMTGFASGQGTGFGLRWSWELRSVNGKGLDVRLRVPDWVEGLEQALRSLLASRLARGNVTVALKLHADGEDAGGLSLNTAQMRLVLDAMTQIEAEAMDRGLTLGPSTAADVVNVRGVLDSSSEERDIPALRAHLLADVAPVIDALVAMRASEGSALLAILSAQIDEIDTLTRQAAEASETRAEAQKTKLQTALARVLDSTDQLDPDRLAQELALIAVKTDVTEELDRLRAHITAARDLLASQGAVGRKLDFLMQEFNREANTLCSKSQSTELTQIGLALKTVIDQMREQVQNLE